MGDIATRSRVAPLTGAEWSMGRWKEVLALPLYRLAHAVIKLRVEPKSPGETTNHGRAAHGSPTLSTRSGAHSPMVSHACVSSHASVEHRYLVKVTVNAAHAAWLPVRRRVPWWVRKPPGGGGKTRVNNTHNFPPTQFQVHRTI